MSNFTFIKAEWPELHDAATKAEGLVYPDARAACFYTRRALELAVTWLYRHDRTLTLSYQDHLSALIHEPSFRQAVGPAVFTKAKLLKDLGNQAVYKISAAPNKRVVGLAFSFVRSLVWTARQRSRRSANSCQARRSRQIRLNALISSSTT